MTNANRIALAGGSLIALAACSPPDPVFVDAGSNEANSSVAAVANDKNDAAETGGTEPGATTGSSPISKPDRGNPARPAPKTAPPKLRPLPSPTSPPAEVDPVRNVDITDPG